MSLARNAAAHGPAPAALEALSKRGDDVSLLRTNLGLARRRASGAYDYVCPGRWDGNELALAVANADGSRVLVHSAGVAWLSEDGGCAFEPLALEAQVRAVVVLGGDTFVLLLRTGAEDAVYDVAAERAFPLADSVDSMTAFASALWIAGAKPAPFLRRIDVQGNVLEERSLDAAAERVTIAGGHGAGVWVALSRDGTSELVWTDGNAVQATGLTSETRFGPVFWQQRWWAVLDGTLYASGAGAVPALDPIAAVDWTCLQTLGKHAYACSLDGLFELASVDEGVPNLSWRFSFEQLGEPSECPNDDASCAQDWAHFAAESGWLDSTPSTEPNEARVPIAGANEPSEPAIEPSAKPASGSCSVGQGGERRGGEAFLAAVLVLVSTVRRRKVSDFRE